MIRGSRRSGMMQQFCSFCSRSQNEVNRLIAGPNSIYICDECVDLCKDILEEEQRPKGHVHPWARRLLPPKEIYRRLNQYVIGQEQAKKVLSVAVYNHYKRIAIGKFTNDDVELQKSNILLLGPTGCGKTLLAQTLARILDVPFCITDATVLTEAGYVGEDVETILRQLIQASDGDVKRAERGIIYIDEIDKVARKSGANPSITRDVSGEGVQQALLKLMEGSVANVPPQGGRKHPHQEYIKIDTTNVLFICGGAFDDLEKIVLDRIESKVTLGFRPGLAQKPTEINNALSHVIADDLMKYGLIPEFIGRLPVLVAVNAMDEETLSRILVEPKNALLKQYKKLFKMDNVDLRFTQEAISVAARKALTLKTGARGLRTVIESTLLDIMFDIPSQSHIGSVEITGEVIAGLKEPLLYDRTEKVVKQPMIQEKAA